MVEFSAYTFGWKRADGTVLGVQERGDLEVDEPVAMDEEKHRNLLILVGGLVGAVVVGVWITLAILNSNWQNDSDNDVKIEKAKACQSIEDDATRALCVSSIE